MWASVFEIFYSSLMTILDVRTLLIIKTVFWSILALCFFPLHFMITEYLGLPDAPLYHVVLELVLVAWVIWLIRKKKKTDKTRVVLTEEEEEEIISQWKPLPLIEKLEETESDIVSYHSDVWPPVDGPAGKYLEIDGIKYLNFATHNYLGLVEDESVIGEAANCIKKYGVGSCGPRGFYGTFDVHLKLEERIAEFLGCEESALYSYGFATIASAIPSYAKNGDIIFVDEQVNFCIQKGVQASRSTIRYFRHNDVEHLETLMDEQAQRDIKNPRKAKTQRRFCIVEGIYMKTGKLCPLNAINKLCLKHKVRLFLDETISLGVLGQTGRGITEHENVPVKDIDFIAGTMEYSFASYGGFIVGTSYVVDHQRISGLGYCFSASLPPLLAGAGLQAINVLHDHPYIALETQQNAQYMQTVLKNLTAFNLLGDPLSPLKFLTLRTSTNNRTRDHELLDRVIVFIKDNYRLAVVQPAMLENEEINLPEPCLRVCVSRLVTQKEMDSLAEALEASVELIQAAMEEYEAEDEIQRAREEQERLEMEEWDEDQSDPESLEGDEMNVEEVEQMDEDGEPIPTRRDWKKAQVLLGNEVSESEDDEDREEGDESESDYDE